MKKDIKAKKANITDDRFESGKAILGEDRVYGRKFCENVGF